MNLFLLFSRLDCECYFLVHSAVLVNFFIVRLFGSVYVVFCKVPCLQCYLFSHTGGPIEHVLTFLMLVIQTQPWRGAGVAVPVFSIRSTHSVGAGEFLDLELVVDMAAKTGMRLVQLLPVNDTSVNMMWWDSYPYRYVGISWIKFNFHFHCCLLCAALLIHHVLETVDLLLGLVI